jgi:hypothetical protein
VPRSPKREIGEGFKLTVFGGPPDLTAFAKEILKPHFHSGGPPKTVSLKPSPISLLGSRPNGVLNRWQISNAQSLSLLTARCMIGSFPKTSRIPYLPLGASGHSGILLVLGNDPIMHLAVSRDRL